MPTTLKNDSVELNPRIQLGDTQSNLDGLRKMFIGYLLNATEQGDDAEDRVKATYMNLSYELENRTKELSEQIKSDQSSNTAV